MNAVRARLGLRLFLSYLVVILVAMVAIGVASRWATPRAFQRHMRPLFTAGEPGRMMGMDRGLAPPLGMMPEFYADFQASFDEAMLLAVMAAAMAAIVVSLALSRSIVAPLRAMMRASGRIAAGKYDERVEIAGPDELGQLGIRFNAMAEKLEQVESMRRRLIGDVAHELRTPLTAIQGSMEGLVDGVLPPTRETYEQIRGEAVRLGRLVDDLQELSRVESRAYALDLRDVDLLGLAKTAVKRLGAQFREKGVDLKLESGGAAASSSVRARVDEDRILQVLTNLAANALQHTPAGGQVTISLSIAGREARVAVRDTGVGIGAEHLPLIFDRFYRVDKSRSRLHGGSGIGLTIARHLVEAHGGRIWAESEGEGKGSVLSFTLPLGT
jgi:histidine kinase